MLCSMYVSQYQSYRNHSQKANKIHVDFKTTFSVNKQWHDHVVSENKQKNWRKKKNIADKTNWSNTKLMVY